MGRWTFGGFGVFSFSAFSSQQTSVRLGPTINLLDTPLISDLRPLAHWRATLVCASFQMEGHVFFLCLFGVRVRRILWLLRPHRFSGVLRIATSGLAHRRSPRHSEAYQPMLSLGCFRHRTNLTRLISEPLKWLFARFLTPSALRPVRARVPAHAVRCSAFSAFPCSLFLSLACSYQRSTRSARSVFQRLGRLSPSSSAKRTAPG
jgi:hypothetical protein